jgi:arsenite methyltransferase
MTAARPQHDVHADVRSRYAQAARSVDAGASGCCGPMPVDIEPGLGSRLYDPSQRHELPAAAVAASLGCGNPTAVAALQPGERVLDLGSGGGIDVLLSARRVGATGFAFGLDMTEEMLELARRNAAEAGVSNVEFLHGQIEAIPLPDASIDVIISNCVVNLSLDKQAVLTEAVRVLVPGGRVGITDIVADEGLSTDERAERGSWAGCIAGALTVGEYEELLTAAGFVDVEITRTHEVVAGMSSAIIRATTPG